MNYPGNLAIADADAKTDSVRRVLYLSAFIDSISVSIILPFLPFMVLEYGGNARTAGYIFAVHAVLAIISGPLFGRLSDKLGRRPALMIGFCGMTCSYAVFGLASSLLQVFVARAIAGAMSGGFGVIQAAVSDLTSRSERAKAMGFVVGASACGFAVGPVIGLVATTIDQHSAAKTASLFGAMLLLGCGLLLWRTVPKKERSIPQVERVEESDARHAPEDGGLKVKLLLTMLAIAMMQAGLTAVLGFWAHAALEWDERGVGWLFVWIFLCIGFNQWFLLPKVLATYVAPKVLWGAILGIFLGALAISSGANQVWVLGIAVAVLFCGIAAGRTVITSMVSTMGTESGRGAALGNLSSAAYVGRAFGPVVFGFLFVEAGPGAPFIATSVVSIACLLWLINQLKSSQADD